MSSASLIAESGVELAGLWMNTLPAASAGPSLVAVSISGKLNGVTAQTTPSGSRRVYTWYGPGTSLTSPSSLSAQPAW